MEPVVRIVVSCTDRKREQARPDLQLRRYADDLHARATAWVARLEAPSCTRRPASDLYQGEHWSIATQLQEVGAAVDAQVQLWVVSAGYGLISSHDLIEPYAATFATRAEDSITRPNAESDPSSDASYWWRRLSERSRPEDTPTTLEALAASDPGAPLVIALSGAYVRAVRHDLLKAATRLARPCQMMLISGGSCNGSLEHLRVPVDARFQHNLGGTRVSLNIRVVKHLLETSRHHRWDRGSVRQLLGDELARLPELARYDRRPLTDSEVRAFIVDEMTDERTPSRSALLRKLRDQDLACEQKRFGALYESVLEELAR